MIEMSGNFNEGPHNGAAIQTAPAIGTISFVKLNPARHIMGLYDDIHVVITVYRLRPICEILICQLVEYIRSTHYTEYS